MSEIRCQFVIQGNPVSVREIRGKSGVSSSFKEIRCQFGKSGPGFPLFR